MTLRRTLRRWISGWLMLAMLFTQIAAAAHACPALVAALAADIPVAGMPCAESMGGVAAGSLALDAEQPGLCLQHCQFGNTQQPADAAPPAVAAVASLLFMVDRLDDATAVTAAWADSRRPWLQAPPPPHSLIHCCWRI